MPEDVSTWPGSVQVLRRQFTSHYCLPHEAADMPSVLGQQIPSSQSMFKFPLLHVLL